MSALTKDFLEGIGIQFDDATFAAFTEHFDTTLQDRILTEIVDELDDGQLGELEQLKSAEGDQLWQWVQANVPELPEIIQEEVDILLGELAENAEHI